MHAGNQSLVVLVGNSKNIWPSFVAACCQEPALIDELNPLDTYIERGVRSAVQTVSG